MQAVSQLEAEKKSIARSSPPNTAPVHVSPPTFFPSSTSSGPEHGACAEGGAGAGAGGGGVGADPSVARRLNATFDPETLVWKSKEDAQRIAEANGYHVEFVDSDRSYPAVTMICPGRYCLICFIGCILFAFFVLFAFCLFAFNLLWFPVLADPHALTLARTCTYASSLIPRSAANRKPEPELLGCRQDIGGPSPLSHVPRDTIQIRFSSLERPTGEAAAGV